MQKRTERESQFLTIDDKKKSAWNSYNNLPKQKSFGEPTYTFQVGDKVRIGALQNCVIEEVTKDHNGTLVYGFTYTDNTAHFFTFF